MAGEEWGRFYLSLLVWCCAFVAGGALTYAGVLEASPSALAFSFVLGLVAVFVFFRPPRA
jgi:hypothetical protein